MATEAQMEKRRANQARYRAKNPGLGAVKTREYRARIDADPIAREARLAKARVKDQERYQRKVEALKADPEYIANKRTPQTREEMLEKQRAYNMLPHVKAKREAQQKRSYQIPEVRDRIKELSAKRFQEKKEHIYELRRKWSPETKARNREWWRKWTQEKRATDIQYRLGNRLRSRLWHALAAQNVRKATKTEELVGCSIGFLRGWLESKFVDGMTWENIGEWHIDHVLPCASFDLSDLEQQHKCFHYTNLAPLWAADNLSKSDSVPEFAV